MRRHLPTLTAAAAAAFTLSACQVMFDVGATLHPDLDTVDMELSVLMDEVAIAVLLGEEVAAVHGQEAAATLSEQVMTDGLDAGLEASGLTAEDIQDVAFQLFDSGADPELQAAIDEHRDVVATERRERDGLYGQAVVLSGLQITDTGAVSLPAAVFDTFKEEGLLDEDLRFLVDEDGGQVTVTVENPFGEQAAAEAGDAGDTGLDGLEDVVGAPFDFGFTLTVPGEVTDHSGVREGRDTVRFRAGDDVTLTFEAEAAGVAVNWTVVAAAVAALAGIALIITGVGRRRGGRASVQAAAAQAPTPVVGGGAVMPAGWYPDPQNPNQFRYWDGFQWTAQTGRS